MNTWILALTWASYILGLIGLVINLKLDHPYFKKICLLAIALALGFHAFGLYQVIDLTGEKLQDLAAVNIFSLIMWLASVIVWFVCLRQSTENLFLLLIPVTLISLLLIEENSKTQLIMTAANPALFWHIMLSILAYSLLALAFIQSLLILCQRGLLKTRACLKWMKLLPSLESMEYLMFLFMLAGFILLSLAIVSILFFQSPIFFTASTKPKFILGCVAWLIFGSVLACRKWYGWQGKQALQWTMVAYFVLFLAFFGTKLLIYL